VLVWLGQLRGRATAACADAERTRGVAWLEPRVQAKISYSEMMHLVEHGEAFEHDDTSLRRFRCRRRRRWRLFELARTDGVVFVGDRRAEQRHDPVAHHLVHRALVAVDGLHHELENGIENLASLLGVAVGEQLHRALEVGEEDCDLLALALEGGWLNLIEAQFGVLKRFTLANTDDQTHRVRRQRLPIPALPPSGARSIVSSVESHSIN
jgi:hypothetical protein